MDLDWQLLTSWLQDNNWGPLDHASRGPQLMSYTIVPAIHVCVFVSLCVCVYVYMCEFCLHVHVCVCVSVYVHVCVHMMNQGTCTYACSLLYYSPSTCVASVHV